MNGGLDAPALALIKFVGPAPRRLAMPKRFARGLSLSALFLFLSATAVCAANPTFDFSYTPVLGGPTTTYSVTYNLYTYDADSALFNPTNMPWWGQDEMTQAFATGVSDQLGTPNSSAGTLYGPLFAFSESSNDVFFYAYDGSSTQFLATQTDGAWYYATATILPEIDGATLPKAILLLGSLYLIAANRRRAGEK
jgi:hypothetical protein